MQVSVPYSYRDHHVWIQTGADSGDGFGLHFGEMNSAILKVDDMDVTTLDRATNSIDKTKYALQQVSDIRSEVGAQQNRLEHTILNENNLIENTTAAESRIRDTDMAAEMVKLSNYNILQQAGQSMLAQVNQSRDYILSLLQ